MKNIIARIHLVVDMKCQTSSLSIIRPALIVTRIINNDISSSINNTEDLIRVSVIAVGDTISKVDLADGPTIDDMRDTCK